MKCVTLMIGAHNYCKKLGNKKEINKNNKNDNRKGGKRKD